MEQMVSLHWSTLSQNVHSADMSFWNGAEYYGP